MAAARSAEVRKEKAERRKMTALDWAAKLVEENGREIYDSYLGAIKAGEWRAADSILNRIYGRPTERVEMKAEPKPIDEMGRAEPWQELERLLADERPSSDAPAQEQPED
jgi:hypothetical protein